jgi:uncharacterized protein (TIGR02145 family)
MKKLSIFFSVLMIALILVNSCKKDEKTDSKPAEVTLATNVIEMNSESNQKLEVVNTSQVVFNGNTTQLEEIKEGMIIISGIAPNAPEGYLRKVTSIKKNGSEYVFTTEEVALTEAFENLDVDYTHKFDDTDSTGRRALGIQVNIPNIVLYDEDGNPSTLYDQLKFNGGLMLRPEFDVKIRIRKAKLEYAFLGANMGMDVNLSTNFGGKLTGFSKNVKLYEQILAAFVIPGTPIVITPTVSVTLGADGSISAQLSYTQSSTGNAGAYLQYINNEWSTESKKDLITETDFSGFAGNITAKAYLAPTINFKFFGSDWAKGSVYTQAYAGLKAQAAPYQPCELKAGVNGGAEANLAFFGKQFASASYPDIFDFSKSVFKCSNTPPSNPYLNPNLTYGSVTDIDGNKYATIQIGFQTWMAENLKTSKYNDGSAIPNITDNSVWSNLSTGAYSVYNYSPENEAIYGKLYNWYAVNTGKLCPQGWRVPTDADWSQLTTYLGSNAGGKMKATGNTTSGTGLWNSPNSGATNESGFTGLPGGERNNDGTFYDVDSYGYWWSSTEDDASDAWSRFLVYDNSAVGRDYGNKRDGFSCRCLRD